MKERGFRLEFSVNLTGPDSPGHPADGADMTFAVVLMAAFDMIATDRNLTRVGYAMADRLDRGIDEFTERQPAYDDYEDADSPF